MHHAAQNPDVERIEKLAHTKVVDCYQCGKCSAGCPMAGEMDFPPSMIIRMLQCAQVDSAQPDRAASASSIWQCVSCLTCSARCPKSVNIAGVMDAMKEISLEKNCVHKKFKRVVAFQKSFLDAIYRNGRTNELEMVVEYKIRGFLGDFSLLAALKDAELGPKMLALGKLHLKPGSPVKNKALVRRIFEKCKNDCPKN